MFMAIFSESTWPIKAKLHVDGPWEAGMKVLVCITCPGHMTKMEAMSISIGTPCPILRIRTRMYDPVISGHMAIS